MIVNPRFSPVFKPLAFAAALAMAFNVHAAETAETDAIQEPWAFNLTLYMWFQGVNGDFSAGQLSSSVDLSFIDIADKLSSFPMAFNGHFEAHYQRLGFYLDGNYLGLNFKPRFDRVSEGASLDLGIMDYGVSYRLFGSTASESVARWEEKARSNVLDIYAGGRTIWFGTQIDSTFNRSASANATTAPVIGGRIMAEFLPKWFLLLDGNVGGFGVDKVHFTGSALGTIGYRTTLFGVPTTVTAGYKALNVNVDKSKNANIDMTMHGPVIGLTGYW